MDKKHGKNQRWSSDTHPSRFSNAVSSDDESEHRRTADVAHLMATFRHTYDESYIRYVWQKNRILMDASQQPFATRPGASRPAGARHFFPRQASEITYLASGLVFSAWRIRTSHAVPGSTERPPMDLVLKVPHSLPRERFGPTFRSWRSLLQRCPYPLGLLPPITLVENEDGFGIVMPFAASPLSEAKPHWLPIDQRVREFNTGLDAVGLALNDPLMAKQGGLRLQAGCWMGIPFIYDLSELGPMA